MFHWNAVALFTIYAVPSSGRLKCVLVQWKQMFVLGPRTWVIRLTTENDVYVAKNSLNLFPKFTLENDDLWTFVTQIYNRPASTHYQSRPKRESGDGHSLFNT